MTKTENHTHADVTVTTNCKDSEVRDVCRVIRQNGGFILSSSMVGNGFQIVHTEYK